MKLKKNIIKIAYTIYFISSVTFAASGDPAWNHDPATQPAWGSLEKVGQPVPLNYPYANGVRNLIIGMLSKPAVA